LRELNLSAECHRGISLCSRWRSVEVKFELAGAGEEVLAEIGAFEQSEAMERFWPSYDHFPPLLAQIAKITKP
jgi:hypothetical protein